MSPEILKNDAIPTPELYPWQEDALIALRNSRMDGVAAGYINLATGLGKTLIAAHDAAQIHSETPRTRILYLCHNSEILRQARDTFADVMQTETHGNLFGGEFEDQEDIVYATFQTMNRSLGKGKVFEAYRPEEFGYIIVDESHHGPANTYRRVIEHFKPDFLLGLTATPDRKDQQDIEGIFGSEIYAVQLEDAIAEGYLASPDYRVLTDHVSQLKKLDTDLGGMSVSQLDKTIFIPRRDEEIVRMIKQESEGVQDPRTIVFCQTTDHADRMAAAIEGTARPLHSRISEKKQAENLRAFRSGEINTIVSVDMLNEGVDIPEANVIVFLRSTQSRTIFLQQLGRGLRKIPGKDRVLVLDFVASWQRIQDVSRLEKDIRWARRDLCKPSRVETNFTFNFSKEALDAISIIESARTKKPLPIPKPRAGRPRAEQWTEDETAVKNMLGIASLPDQSLSSSEWNYYEKRMTSGDSKAIEELLMRRLRSIYRTARNTTEAVNSPELTIEDMFQSSIEHIMIELADFKESSNGRDLRTYFGLSLFGAVGKIPKSRGLISNTTTQETIDRIERSRKELSGGIGRAAYAGIKPVDLSQKTNIPQEEIDVLATLEYENLLDIDDIQDELPGHQTDDNGFPLGVVANLMKRDIANIISKLSYRDRRVIELMYGLNDETPQSLEQIGREFNVTRERVRQISKQIVDFQLKYHWQLPDDVRTALFDLRDYIR